MTTGDADIAKVGALIADPARARILLALGDGRSLPATVLASEAGVSPSTTSAHLGKLVGGGLLTVRRQGRHRYFALAGPAVGEAIERLMMIAPAAPVRSLRQGTRANAVRSARTCYDHLAGVLGAGLMGAMLDRGLLVDPSASPAAFEASLAAPGDRSRDRLSDPGSGSRDRLSGPGSHSRDRLPGPGSGSRDRLPGPGSGSRDRLSGPGSHSRDRLSGPGSEHCYELTDRGRAELTAFGLDLDGLQRLRRPLIRYCVDWSEQRHHLAGALGAAITRRTLELGWITRARTGRAVHVTDAGRAGLDEVFGLSTAQL